MPEANRDPAGTQYRCTFTVNIPAAATSGEVHDWIRFVIGANGSLSGANPLVDKDLEAYGTSVQRLTVTRAPTV